MSKTLSQIQTQIAGIKEKLMKAGEMRPGSLTYQYQKPKEKKGGFYQISYTHHMKSKTEYVRAQFVKDLQAEIKEFKKFKDLVQTWTDLAIEYSKLKMELAKNAEK